LNCGGGHPGCRRAGASSPADFARHNASAANPEKSRFLPGGWKPPSTAGKMPAATIALEFVVRQAMLSLAYEDKSSPAFLNR